jgi:hypothetical protein
MQSVAEQKEFVTFTPDLRAADPRANYWMRQVTIRLRREVAWCWHERGLQPPTDFAMLPPYADKLSTILDLSRFYGEKQDFFLTDPTARYLTDQLNQEPSFVSDDAPARGSFGWVVNELALPDVASFILALSLSAAFDANMGSVIACCLNDQNKLLPTLALAQKLWDEPEEVLSVADPVHPLFRYGLIRFNDTSWNAPITVPSLVALQLLFPNISFPHGLVESTVGAALRGRPTSDLDETAHLSTLRLRSTAANSLRIVPVIGSASQLETVTQIAELNEKALVVFTGDTAAAQDVDYLNALATVCWLKDAYLYLDKSPAACAHNDKHKGHHVLPSSSIPATLFIALKERNQRSSLPQDLVLPAVVVPPVTYHERLECWRQHLDQYSAALGLDIAECARRFRFEKQTIRAICGELKELQTEITAKHLVAACRAELDTDIGELATRVTPRFNNEELILPHKQSLLFGEILKAMQSLTEVHYGWGTGKVWNESGISVLFAGPPGTGKTMGAEILAIKLDLPMYRIDLSQVVNKYIGETEKNLKRVFDVADVSDMILFFDEADSLFGRRTEVSDAHDRYANLEISYLLERMERFKGLAILATNRKKDLDEAFLRRLRYIVDFPLPDAEERKKIWRQVVPEHADSSQLEFEFLAEQFPLSGGNIRSIVFNACLQCADGSKLVGTDGVSQLTMKEVIVAVKREFDKMNRSLSLEQYGAYASLVEGLERE